MATIVAGLVGGLIATIVMTGVMMAMGDGGPPPAQLIAKFTGSDPEEYKMPGMALHLVYGIVAGAVFAVGVPLLDLSLSSLAVAIGLGLAYGIVLMVVGMVFWMRLVIGVEPDKSMMTTFGTAHVVYGLVLGAFLGAGLLA